MKSTLLTRIEWEPLVCMPPTKPLRTIIDFNTNLATTKPLPHAMTHVSTTIVSDLKREGFARVSRRPSRLRALRQALVFTLLALVSFWLPICARAEPHETTLKLIKQEKFNEAQRFIEVYLQDHPNDPQMKFWMALLLDKQGETQTSLKLYREITQQYPELPEPHNNLGMALAKMGALDEAKAEFEMALREQPDMANAMENLFQVYLLLTRQTLQKALSLNPRSPVLAQKLQAVDARVNSIEQPTPTPFHWPDKTP